jgi:alpha-amylase
VIVALDQPAGEKSVSVSGVFADGTELIDGYSNVRATVREGRVTVTTPYTILLLGSFR